jgi:hypothetical protein
LYMPFTRPLVIYINMHMRPPKGGTNASTYQGLQT